MKKDKEGVNLNNVETKLKVLILTRYKSIREFAISINMPYSTIDNILKKGVDTTNITNIFRICKKLDISVDALADGEIRHNNIKKYYEELAEVELYLIRKFQTFDAGGQEKIIEYINDLESAGKYSLKKLPQDTKEA